jgi:hypothetical protein
MNITLFLLGENAAGTDGRGADREDVAIEHANNNNVKCGEIDIDHDNDKLSEEGKLTTSGSRVDSSFLRQSR